MKRRTLITSLILMGVIVSILIYSLASGEDSAKHLETEVTFGEFEIVVTVTGELEAERSIDIQAPEALGSRELRFRSITIQDLVPEGTEVDSGDYVATLDRTEADNTHKDAMDELEIRESDYLRTQLDTTLELRQLRDDLVNLVYNMEEAEITLEQSQFEPPATIRQAQINLDKITRSHEQAIYNYSLRVEQARSTMTEVRLDLEKQQSRVRQMEEVLNQFVVRAPASGMVIYKLDWGGNKRVVGSEINTRDLTVAQLPDMSSFICRTYVNEIDVSKVRADQPVRVGVDAFPEKTFTGRVTSVANIGEQLPNTDAKVFEVFITLNESDPILRPAMTTSNSIITQTFSSALSVPLEAVHSNDSLTYVYRSNKIKQVVVLGEANENQIIVEAGLDEDDLVLLSIPEDAEEMKWTGLELVEVIRQKESEEKRLQEEQQKRMEEMANKRNGGRTRTRPAAGEGGALQMPTGPPPGGGGQFRRPNND